MKTLLLNLPHPQRMMRRYICSFNAPNFLMPPHELLCLGGMAVHRMGGTAQLLDAIAEGLSLQETLEAVHRFEPDLVVSLIGFECLENDIAALDAVKQAFPKATTLAFGHYPTLFAKEILENSSIDGVLLGEPEESFLAVYQARAGGEPLPDAPGIARRVNGRIQVNPSPGRLRRLDDLPLPAHHLIKPQLYSEPFLGSPLATIQTTRGCPFPCNYCVRSYGQQTMFRSPESVLEEIHLLVNELKIPKIRFVDDTFNVDPRRTRRLCELILNEGFKFQWSCLNRVDTIDEETFTWMRRAGCVRTYLGFESGSQKVLDYYQKKLEISNALEKVRVAKRTGMEVVGYFMVGAPDETEQDVAESIRLAKEAQLDYILVSTLTLYPGTPLYERLSDRFEFSLFPSKGRFKDPSLEERAKLWERRFYREFYLSPRYLFARLAGLVRRPRETLANARLLLDYVRSSPDEGRERADLI